MQTASKVNGVDQLVRQMDLLSKKMQDQGSRKAVTEAAKPIVAATKNAAPERTGLLAQSIGSKVLRSKSGSGYSALIGAKHLKITKKRKKAGFKIRARVRRNMRRMIFDGGDSIDPARYLHLVELGHRTRARTLMQKIRRAMGGGRKVPGVKFMEAGLKTAESAAASAAKNALAAFILENVK